MNTMNMGMNFGMMMAKGQLDTGALTAQQLIDICSGKVQGQPLPKMAKKSTSINENLQQQSLDLGFLIKLGGIFYSVLDYDLVRCFLNTPLFPLSS